MEANPNFSLHGHRLFNHSKPIDLTSYDGSKARSAVRVLDSNPITKKIHEGVQQGRASGILWQSLVQDYVEPGMRVLDIGIGTGHIAHQLAGMGLEVTGVDIADIRTTSNQASNLILAEGHFLPVKPESFDIVTLIDVLHFCRSQEALLSEAYQALKPGGAVIVVEDEFTKYGVDPFFGLATNLMNRILNCQPNLNPYFFHSQDELRDMLIDADFGYFKENSSRWGLGIFQSVSILGLKLP